MSVMYPQYPNSNFPAELDNWIRRQDPNSEDVALINQFKNYILAGDITSAQNLIIANPSLKSKIFDSDALNNLQDGLLCLENFFKDSVEGYIDTKQTEMQNYVDVQTTSFDTILQQFDNKGAFSTLTTYQKWNTVTFNYQTYMSLQNNNLNHTPIGVTDTFWQLMAERGATGQKGDNGIGLTFIGNYSAGTTYYIGNAVNYNNNIYYAINTTTGNIPTNLTYWALFLSNSGIVIQNTEPVSKYTNLVWIDSSTTQNIMKYWDGSVWVICGNTAVNIAITDIGDIITATNVEDALQEIATNMANNSNQISVLNGSSALVMTSTQDGSSRTTNITYKRSDTSTYKTIDYSNFDANSKPQTVITKLYSSTSVLQSTNTATVVWSTDGTYIISSNEVIS